MKKKSVVGVGIGILVVLVVASFSYVAARNSEPVDEYGFRPVNAEPERQAKVVVPAGDVEETTLQVFPNPATNIVNINCDIEGRLRIINLAGQTLLELKTRKGANQLNVQHLNQGLYMIQFTNHTGAVSTQKLLIR